MDAGKEDAVGYSVGFDSSTNRDIGYGVPAVCDHPGCSATINRGMSYACGGAREDGCGLFFCEEHRRGGRCARCACGRSAFAPKADVDEWVRHKLTDPSWAQWRQENPEAVQRLSGSSAP